MSEKYELPEDILKGLIDEEEKLEYEQEPSQESEPISEEVQEPEVPEVQTPEPAQAQEPEMPAWMEDFSRLESRLEAYNRQVAEKLDHLTRNFQPQPARQDDYSVQYEQDPALLKAQELERRMQEYERSIAIGNERSQMNQAVSSMAQRFPDFHNYIPPQVVEMAFQKSVQDGVRIPWQAHLEQNYWMRKGPQVAQELQAQKDELQRQADELERKRVIKEQKLQESQRASNVPSGGGNFQQRERVLDPNHHGYSDAIALAKAAVQEKLGG